MNLVKVKRIFDAETFTPNAGFSFVNCHTLQGQAKEAWLIRDPTSELYQRIETEDPHDVTAIKGVWIAEESSNHGVLIDGTLSDFVEKCNGCCGDEAEVDPIYNNTFPDVLSPVAKTYTIVRDDDGSGQALRFFELDYNPYIIPGTVVARTYDSGAGESTYVIQSYDDPAPMKADTVTETARVFDSNAPGALSGAEDTYNLAITINGAVLTPVQATTIAGLATAATTAYGTTYGAFSSALTNTITRLTSTNIDTAVLAITKLDLT